MLLSLVILHGSRSGVIWAKRNKLGYFSSHSHAEYYQNVDLEFFCTDEYKLAFRDFWFSENPDFPEDCDDWIDDLIYHVNTR